MREMKETGVVWCPSIPSDWELRRVKDCFTISKVKAGIKNPTVLKLARSGIQVKDVTVNEGQMAESYDDYNPVQIGDLLLNPMDLYSGANCNVSEVEGVISPAYVNLRAKARLNPFYFDYYFKLQYWAMAMFAHGKGVSYDNRWTINAEGVKSYEVPFPTIEEQNRIVEIIKNKCSQIDALIANAEQQITKLKAYKQSVITETVTKGLNPDVTMKDSGVEWIGDIPNEWNTTKLGRISSVRSGITLGRKIPENAKLIERPYLRVANVQNGYVDNSTVTTLSVTEEEDIKYRLHKNDVLMTEGGDRDKLGRGCVWDGSIEPCLHQNHIFALQTNPKFLNQFYFAYITASKIGRVYFDITAIKTTNLACTSSSKVMAFIIPLPSIEEQIEIADYLDHKCSQIDKLIALKQQKIEKLQQYKKSLIYEYVTGKKEV